MKTRYSGWVEPAIEYIVRTAWVEDLNLRPHCDVGSVAHTVVPPGVGIGRAE